MSYSVTNGYSPQSYTALLEKVVEGINEQFGTDFTTDSIVGTNWWKYFYTAIQLVMEAENNTAQLSAKMQDYIRTQNEELIEPRGTPNGLMKAFENELNIIASVKPTEQADAGHLYLAVDVDEFAEDYSIVKQKIFDLLSRTVDAGVYFEGAEQGTVTALNGQQFDYAFDLPSPVALKIKIDVYVTENKDLFIETTNSIKDKFLSNFNKLYRLGYDFEPQQFLNIERDLPFASEINIQYSTDGVEWKTDVLSSIYDEKFTIAENEVIVEVH